MAAFEPEVVVELDAELDEIVDPRRCLAGERGDGARSGEPAARSQGVLGVE